MVAVSLVFLCVFIFSAYAYGATTVLAFRQLPIWTRGDAPSQPRSGIDPATLALCLVCTAWFIMHALLEFRQLLGGGEFGGRFRDLPDAIGLLLSYSFPPLIMHTVLNEQDPECGEVAPIWRRLVQAMYVVALIVCVYVILAIYNVVPRPSRFGGWAGLMVGVLFTACSVYCIALLSQRRPAKKPSQSRLRPTMVALFLMMIPLFFALVFMRERQYVTYALDRVTRTLPIFFLIASVYFENRFEFYDLIVKRAATLLVNLLVIGAYLALILGALEGLPAGAARPWLFAVALLPLAMVLQWLHTRVSRWLDRMWFGREFTPVEAVKQVLSAMQPATDERALVEATEARLSDMFNTRVQILLDDQQDPEGVAETIAVLPSTATGMPLRVAVARQPGSRPLLSEDIALLRSLASVFAYMLENVRLQRRRQEQDQVAQELRLQTSRSELKALRAQINPHFLFNALNAIASLIHTDPARADAAVEQLAEVFRYTLRRSEQEWAPLDQELAFAQAYLDVEQARFGRRLSFSIEAMPAATAAQVPAMLLHTLVENAVKHGISQVRGAGRIDIRARVEGAVLTCRAEARSEESELVLEVSDTGPGPEGARRAEARSENSEGTRARRAEARSEDSERRRDGERFGLRSIRDRLRGHFGERGSFDLVRDEERGVTIARVHMPLVTETLRERTFVKEPA